MSDGQPEVILVTGGTGFIGRCVITKLAVTGRRVRVLTRVTGARLPDGIETVTGDLLDPESLRRAVANVGVVVHLAGALSGAELQRVNVEGTRRLAEAALKANITAFVHCSSAGIYGDRTSAAPINESDWPQPGTLYERSKLEGEQALTTVLGRAVPWVVLRPSGVYGPGRPATLEFCRVIRRRRLWVHGPSTVIVHPTYVDDLVAAVAAAVERTDLAREIINVGGERPVPFRDLIALTARAMNTRVRQVSLPASARYLSARISALGVMRERLDRFARPLVYRGLDTTKAARLLNVRPIPLEEGVTRTVDSLQAQGLL